jgi:hypothetical protein
MRTAPKERQENGDEHLYRVGHTRGTLLPAAVSVNFLGAFPDVPTRILIYRCNAILGRCGLISPEAFLILTYPDNRLSDSLIRLICSTSKPLF